MIYAIAAFTLALVFYTIGIWAQKQNGSLQAWHVIVLWIGFIFDFSGTARMVGLSKAPLDINFHSVIGYLAITLMLLLAVLATCTLLKGSEIQKRDFYRFSIAVWIIWILSYLSGIIVGMMGNYE
jgi:TIGR03987 family protein